MDKPLVRIIGCGLISIIFQLPGVALTNITSTNVTTSVVVKYTTREYYYFLITNQEGDNQASEDFCQNEYDGHLATFQDRFTYAKINLELQINKLNNNLSLEIWVGGRTNETSGPLDISADGIVYATDNGKACLVLDDTREEDENIFQIYPKDCYNTTAAFLCVQKRVPPYTHLYLESSGQCPPGSRLTMASVYMSPAVCQALDGQAMNAPSPEDLLLCRFDICGASTTEEIKGIVMAGIGMCPGKNVYPVHVGPLMGSECYSLHGNQSYFTEFGVPYPQPHCQLEACRKTMLPNHATVSFSASVSNCSLEDRVRGGSLLVQNPEYCAEIHGYSSGASIVNHTRCILDLCHLGVPDCKTSEMGQEYTGKLSVTISGKVCQRWDRNWPHDHRNTNPDWFPDRTLSDAANYCRNPGDWMEGPFCYTTDPDTPWEICDLPYCEGHGPSLEEYQMGRTRYIYVQGKHDDPAAFCAKAYGAAPAMLEGSWEVEGLSLWLGHLHINQLLSKQEVWVGGRAPASVVPNTAFEDFKNIVKDGKTGHCLLLSNWNITSQGYNSSSFALYTDNCPVYYGTFICEVSETRIEHYEVHGGVPQIGVHEKDVCLLSCQKNCLAVGYDSLEESCWHYVTDVPAPGRSKWNFDYIQRAPSVCHNYLLLMDQNVVLTASSLKNSFELKVPSANQAKITSRSLVTQDGLQAGAWIPATYDTNQWIQAQFSEAWMVYGLVVLGMEHMPGSMIQSFKLQTSLKPDCANLTYYGDGKTFHGSRSGDDSITIILEQSVMAFCVRLNPQTWNQLIAMRFDVLGCTERNNIALGASMNPVVGDSNVETSRAVDGFTVPLPSWGGCVTTTKRNYPFLAVQFSHFYDVEEIHLYSQKGCCDGELKEISVKVTFFPPSGTTFNREDECGYISSGMTGSLVQKITCSPRKTGRYVQIQKNDHSSQISVCEIKVYGHKSLLQNRALNKKATQSDTYISRVAGLAVDGRTTVTSSMCSTTASALPIQWWMVDLEETLTVKEILIYTCCFSIRNLAIYVSDSMDDKDSTDESNLCVKDDRVQVIGAKQHKVCITPMNGRYVKIVMNYKSKLYLCEVEVLAESLKIQTYSGNAENAVCHLPFTYKNNSYYTCTKRDRDGRFWCATTEDYDKDQTWGYCMDVSLWGGRGQSEGLVLVRGWNDEFLWGSVCDDDWDDTDARIACQLLGFKDGKAVYPPFFSTGPGEVAVSNMKCQGDETSIMKCEHEKSPDHCTHYEDAAVKCLQHDIQPSFGYPSRKRRQVDDLSEGIFISPSSQEITVPGIVVSWKFYSIKKENSKLSLQIWRRMYDLEGMRFLLVGSMDVSKSLVVDGEVTVVNPSLIHVQSGDRIGFAFTGSNAIPYDHSFRCLHHGRMVYRTNSTVPTGGITSFIDKEDAHLGCRLYSLFAKIEVQAIQSLKEFLFEGRLYRIFTVPNTKSSADILCTNKFGSTGHLLHLNSLAEYNFVKGFLQDIALKGKFWLNNTIEYGHLALEDDWAPCQPEEGKECLIISNDNKDENYFWYSSTCVDKHYFICETDPPTPDMSTMTNSKGGVTTISTATQPYKPKPEKQTAPSSVRHWPIVVGILVPVIVIGLVIILVVVLIKYNRLGKKPRDFPLMTHDIGHADSSFGDDQMSVTSEPAAGLVTLHKNNNDF